MPPSTFVNILFGVLLLAHPLLMSGVCVTSAPHNLLVSAEDFSVSPMFLHKDHLQGSVDTCSIDSTEQDDTMAIDLLDLPEYADQDATWKIGFIRVQGNTWTNSADIDMAGPETNFRTTCST